MGEAKRRGSYEERVKQAQAQLKDADSMHQYHYNPAEPEATVTGSEAPVANVVVWGETDWIAIEWGTMQQRIMQTAFEGHCKRTGQSVEQAKDTLLAQVGTGLNNPTTPPDQDQLFLIQLGMYVSQCMTPNTGWDHNYAVALCFKSPLGSRGYACRWLGTQNASSDQQAIAQALQTAVPILGHKMAEEFAGSQGYRELISTLKRIGVPA